MFTEHFGAAWMEKWKIAFRSRVDGWAGDPDMDDAIQVEVEFASDADHEELPGELFELMYDLTNEEATEQALLEGLQAAVIAHLNLHAPELVSRDEHLELRLEIIGYGGG